MELSKENMMSIDGGISYYIINKLLTSIRWFKVILLK